MHQIVTTIYYFFWIRYHSSRVYFQKNLRLETKYRPPFPPTTKPHPLNPLNRRPTSLVLARYKLMVLRPFCVCSTIFYFCLLSFPRHFCRSKLALFRFATCLCLISTCVSCCVCLPRRFYRSRLVLFCSTACLCLISSRVFCCVCHFL